MNKNIIPFDTLLLSIYYGPSINSTCIGQTFASMEIIKRKFEMIFETEPLSCSSDDPGYWIITIWRRKSLEKLLNEFNNCEV